MGRRTAALAALALAVGLLASCTPRDTVGPGAGNASTDPSTTTVPSGPDSPAPSSSVARVEDHAVPPPGRSYDRLWPADILVVAKQPLTDAMVDRIGRVPGVAQVELMGLGQVSLENRVVNVAAVDPATYRRFTPVGSAQTQQVWDRVAGGELAIAPGLGRRLAGEDGTIRLGVSADAPSVHVGAYAPGVPSIPVVVNRTWTRPLKMPFGNAVLLSTDRVSPSVVRPRIQEIVGDTASIQALDVVARLGLDPNARQVAVFTGGSVSDLVGTFNYRVLGGGQVAPDPAWVSTHISTQVMPIIGSMTCNRAMFPQLEAALEEIQGEGLAGAIHPGEYAGCYYPRFIANTTTLSNHAFGLAFDINTPGNQRGSVGEIDRRVVAIFERWGFSWGGRWSWTDPMHFEMNRVVEPG